VAVAPRFGRLPHSFLVEDNQSPLAFDRRKKGFCKMSLHLVNLDEKTRKYMLSEIESDVSKGTLYISPRLSLRGRQDYVALLKQAAIGYDDGWLAGNLRVNGRISSEEQRRKPKGGYTTARVPVTAPDTLAEGEFNRFYIRGLCLRAIEHEVAEVVVYRAKEVTKPRLESEALIGARLNVRSLLQDIRTHPGVDTALRLPPGPNSGLSVQLP
jgi:hypothetical protein